MLKDAEKQAKRPYKDTGATNKNALEANTGGQKIDLQPIEKETRCKRLQVLVTPTTLTALDQLAGKNGNSRNDIINKILNDYLERN